MDSSLVALLADPVTRSPLTLADGELRGGGREYAIADGIPRLLVEPEPDQARTSETFAYKWGRRETYESDEWREVAGAWLAERYGFEDVAAMRADFGARGWVLDAGCGAGFSAALWLAPGWSRGSDWVGVDISPAVEVARERLAGIEATHFLQADVLHLPFRDASFDLVFAEGVLHHTPSTWDALTELVRVLRPGGEAAFYVYRRKGPVREFTDDYVRSVVAELPPEEAWELLRPLTLLGRALAELRQEVIVPEPIPYLGIPAGRIDVQRLLYWHFVKAFWNERLTVEENVHVNFDWYHPRYAHRHTAEEVRDACRRNALEIVRFDEQESGFTVRAVKR